MFITIENLNKAIEVEYGASLLEVAKNENITLPYPILGALVNNQVRSLQYQAHKPCCVKYFDITSSYGIGVYTRSLYFILFASIKALYPRAKLNILHSISGGKYCEIENIHHPINESVLLAIKNKMDELIAANLPFVRKEVPYNEAIEVFKKQGFEKEKSIFSETNKMYLTIHQLGDAVNYYYGSLLPSTGYITLYGLELYEHGLLLKIPNRKRPDVIPQTRKMSKLFHVYKQFKEWSNKLNIPYIYDLNEKINSGQVGELILTTEALQEKVWANVADEIHRKEAKMVLISGPSSSGKTTSCKRLSVQLGVIGYHPVQISVDDFFVEREESPRDKNGNYDFEALEAIDLKLFNETLDRLLAGEEVELPTFNFQLGTKEWKGKKVAMQGNSILVIEGIHCLNPKLTASIVEDVKYKIFVSALTSLSVDSQNPIPTTDTRLIRRIIRDFNYRGYSALDTLRRWQSVRDGEEKNIFPYQENADIMFNTSLIYELAVLRPYAMPILMAVPEYEPEFAEAIRLIKFLGFFKPISDNMIPGTSILREFVGGSKFSY
ncbi:MAG: nucleoside kinase [Bacteroidetes bacterium]|nr:nucleoside kinase [Bacteroidota bacterium]MCL2301915.1 nucleoside kinase [Lentimicrobiaceae bacterium]